MKNLLYLIVLGLFFSGGNDGRPMPNTASGTIVRLESFGSGGVTPRDVEIWLPEGYDEQRQYAVLYMHDGQMLFDSTITWNKQEWQVDEVMGRLLAADKIKPTIVVGIYNGDDERHADYFPQRPFEQVKTNFGDSLLQADPETYEGLKMTVQSDAYLKFIIEEVKPFIDENYAVATDPANTFVMGSSMGGLISMYALAEYPEVFGGAACLSTHWIGFWEENKIIPRAFGAYLKEKLPVLEGKKLYFDYGNETLDAKYDWAQKHIDELIISDSTVQLNYKSEFFEGAAHDEVSWAERLDIPLTFLLGK